MEQLIKNYIKEGLVEEKISLKSSINHIIKNGFIDEVSYAFSIPRDLVIEYISEYIPNHIIDRSDNIFYVYSEVPELFKNNYHILGVIDDIKLIKHNYVVQQNYAMAAQYRDYEKSLEKSISDKWDGIL